MGAKLFKKKMKSRISNFTFLTSSLSLPLSLSLLIFSLAYVASDGWLAKGQSLVGRSVSREGHTKQIREYITISQNRKEIQKRREESRVEEKRREEGGQKKGEGMI